MPSAALLRWSSDRKDELDEVESAHARVGGTKRGRRHATQQINRAYAVLLASQFQGFCRDLHTECIEWFVPSGLPIDWEMAIRSAFESNRRLDTGNPNPGNIGSDFARFGIQLWAQVHAFDPQGRDRQASLERLLLWRNAIAHQDFKDPRLGPLALRLAQVRAWRRTCGGLEVTYDAVMANCIGTVTGRKPW